MDLCDILREIFPSKEMAEYLSTQQLEAEKIAEAVRGAPISLIRKRELLYTLAESTRETLYIEQANEMDQAIQEMAAKPNDVFYVKDFWLDEEIWEVDPDGDAPFLTMEQAVEWIREFQVYEEFDENTLWWFGIEKWSPDENGKLIHTITYYVLGDVICYFKKENHISWRDVDYFESTHLNLPVPFRPGDIVEIDCRPFAPVTRAVILEVGDNCGCCCLQALFPCGKGRWSVGAVKHGHVYPRYCYPAMSPLYRIARYRGPLSKVKQVLLRASRYLQGDEKRGRALGEFIIETAGRRRHFTATSAEILTYIEEKDGPSAGPKANI